MERFSISLNNASTMNEHQVKLSVIVPVYKVEDCLSRCLTHLTDQDFSDSDYEIICVNDGSPDNSREIVKEFQKNHPQIKLIDQENKGVSVARNEGLKSAEGKYVMFIDSDDFVERKSLAEKLQIIEEQKCQVGFLGFTILDEAGNKEKEVYYESYPPEILDGKNAYFKTHFEGSSDPDRIYAVVLEKQFLLWNSLYFTPDVPYLEDGELLTRILCLAERCFFVQGPFYLRTTRPGSATNSDLFVSMKAIDGFIKSAVNLTTFKNTATTNELQKRFLNQPIVKYVILAYSAAFSSRKFANFRYVCREFKSHGLHRVDIKDCKSMYRRLGRVYNTSGYLLFLYLLFRPAGHFIKRLFSFR